MKRSISHFFIDRPAFAMVISIVITIVGIVGYFRLPVAQYPNVVLPSVVVRTSYPRASHFDGYRCGAVGTGNKRRRKYALYGKPMQLRRLHSHNHYF